MLNNQIVSLFSHCFPHPNNCSININQMAFLILTTVVLIKWAKCPCFCCHYESKMLVRLGTNTLRISSYIWFLSTMLKNYAFQYFRVYTVELVVLMRKKKLPVMQVHLHISWPGDFSVPADLLWAYCCWICKWSLPLLCILLVGRYMEFDVVSYTSLHCLCLLADYLCWIARYMELHVIWYTIPAAITWVLLVDYP